MSLVATLRAFARTQVVPMIALAATQSALEVTLALWRVLVAQEGAVVADVLWQGEGVGGARVQVVRVVRVVREALMTSLEVLIALEVMRDTQVVRQVVVTSAAAAAACCCCYRCADCC